MIKVTDNAKSKALQLMSEDGKNGYFIRVGVKGSCSGLMYELDLIIHYMIAINPLRQWYKGSS